MAADNSSYGRIFNWCLLVCSAALCADITAASLGNYWAEEPSSIKVMKRSYHSHANSKVDESLLEVLRQPEPPKPTEPVKHKVLGPDGEEKLSSNNNNKIAKDEKKKEPKIKVDMNKIVLKGTILGDTYRGAILELPVEGVKVVGLGEELGGYMLTEVDTAWARFENTKEELLFVASSMSSLDPKMQDNTPLVKKRDLSESEVENKEEQKEEEEATGEDQKVTIKEVREALDNSAEMAKQLRVVPQEKDGQPYGTRVDFRDNGNLLARMGVKNHDILLSINGVPTRSAEEMYRGYMTLRNASSFEFVVERNGAEQTIRYELGQ